MICEKCNSQEALEMLFDTKSGRYVNLCRVCFYSANPSNTFGLKNTGFLAVSDENEQNTNGMNPFGQGV